MKTSPTLLAGNSHELLKAMANFIDDPKSILELPAVDQLQFIADLASKFVPPKAIVLELSGYNEETIDILKFFYSSFPDTPIVAVDIYDDLVFSQSMLHSGAAFYICFDHYIGQINEALNELHTASCNCL